MLFALLLVLFPLSVWGETQFQIDNSFQTGFEYDTNVLKTFTGPSSDGLARILFSSKGTLTSDQQWRMGYSFQGGGKKYFDHGEQDTLIQYIELPLSIRSAAGFSISLTPNFKYQNESDDLDTQGTGALDINEDYFSTAPLLSFRIPLPGGLSLEPFGEFTYFHFDPQDNFSFFRERGGAVLRRSLPGHISLGGQYAYGRQQFEGTTREDREHEAVAFVQYTSVPFVSVRYAYQNSDSSDPAFAFTNHRIHALLSMPLWTPERSEEAGEADAEAALLALHVIGTLQLKNFPSVFVVNAEGQRYLLTGAEDDNFNSVLVKLTYHPRPYLAVETKYTRYSNELSSQQDGFVRSLYYAGIRLSF